MLQPSGGWRALRNIPAFRAIKAYKLQKYFFSLFFPSMREVYKRTEKKMTHVFFSSANVTAATLVLRGGRGWPTGGGPAGGCPRGARRLSQRAHHRRGNKLRKKGERIRLMNAACQDRFLRNARQALYNSRGQQSRRRGYSQQWEKQLFFKRTVKNWWEKNKK